MIIRRKPIKKSNKREYIIIETPGPGGFLRRATEKDKAIKLLFGEGKELKKSVGLDLTSGKVVDAFVIPAETISVSHLQFLTSFLAFVIEFI